MGEMADFFIDQELDCGEWHMARTLNRERNKATCKICGATSVHWRLFAGEYKVADDQRQHPGNRYVQHLCATTADGFEDCHA